MAEESSLSDVALMVRVHDGDERAFEELHRRYQRRVLTFFHGMCCDAQAASDLCQETFLRVWKVRRRYRATGVFAGYLFGIARLIWLERCREERKRRKLGRSESLDAAGQTVPGAGRGPGEEAARAEVSAHIARALDELPEDQRMVFVLRTMRGLTLEDIASALDCPINTVRSRKILAVKKLRQSLAGVFSRAADRVF